MIVPESQIEKPVERVVAVGVVKSSKKYEIAKQCIESQLELAQQKSLAKKTHYFPIINDESLDDNNAYVITDPDVLMQARKLMGKQDW